MAPLASPRILSSIIFVITLMFIPTCGKGSTAPSDSVRKPASQGTSLVVADSALAKKIVLEGMQFNTYGSPDSNSEAILDAAVEILETLPNTTFYVEMETCTGMRSPNVQLSSKRAAAIADYLEKHGIPSNRLIPRECATRMAANNTNDATDDGTRNLRVELVQIN